MKRSIMLTALAVAAVSLAGCHHKKADTDAATAATADASSSAPQADASSAAPEASEAAKTK